MDDHRLREEMSISLAASRSTVRPTHRYTGPLGP